MNVRKRDGRLLDRIREVAVGTLILGLFRRIRSSGSTGGPGNPGDTCRACGSRDPLQHSSAAGRSNLLASGFRQRRARGPAVAGGGNGRTRFPAARSTLGPTAAWPSTGTASGRVPRAISEPATAQLLNFVMALGSVVTPGRRGGIAHRCRATARRRARGPRGTGGARGASSRFACSTCFEHSARPTHVGRLICPTRTSIHVTSTLTWPPFAP